MAGSLVLIDSATASNSATVTLGGTDWDNTYNVYMVSNNNVVCQTDTQGLLFRLLDTSNNPLTASSYEVAWTVMRANTTPENAYGNNAFFMGVDNYIGTGTGEVANGTHYIFNANNASEYTMITQTTAYVNNSAQLRGMHGGGVFESAEATKGAAQYDRKNKIIRLDRKFLQTKLAEKAWTAMRELIEVIDGEKITSKAENLPADSFNTYNEFEKFVIEHEYQHSLYSRKDFNNDFPNVTKGEYETAINNRALAAIQQSLQESTEVSYKLDGSNLRLLESELDVHTLSVVFPAAINADGTVKTGEAADAAIGKLGKFLKVCS